MGWGVSGADLGKSSLCAATAGCSSLAAALVELFRGKKSGASAEILGGIWLLRGAIDHPPSRILHPASRLFSSQHAEGTPLAFSTSFSSKR